MAGEIVSLSSHAGSTSTRPRTTAPLWKGAPARSRRCRSWLFGPGVVLDVQEGVAGEGRLRCGRGVGARQNRPRAPRLRRRARMDGDEPRMPGYELRARGTAAGRDGAPRRPRRTSHRHRRLGPGSSLRRHGGGGEGGRHRAAVSAHPRAREGVLPDRAARESRAPTAPDGLHGIRVPVPGRGRERWLGPRRGNLRGVECGRPGGLVKHVDMPVVPRSRISILFQDDHADRSPSLRVVTDTSVSVQPPQQERSRASFERVLQAATAPSRRTATTGSRSPRSRSGPASRLA